MRFLKEKRRTILWTTFAISFYLMTIDLTLNFGPKIFMYSLMNANIIFRLFGVCIYSQILHIVIMLALIVITGLYWDRYALFLFLFLVVPMILLFLLSIFSFYIRGTKQLLQHAYKVGLHAYLGILICVIWFWTYAFVLKDDNVHCLLEITYFLLFLFMMLTPYFQTSSQALPMAHGALKL